MAYDAIIIGGGLGGLTAGAKLAKEGRRVLLVEQHAVVGGCATTFRRKGFTVEVGLHEMDGPVPGDPKSAIFDELGVTDGVELVRVPEFYRFVNGRLDIVIPDDAAAAQAVLLRRFPHEERGIRRFFKTILGLRREAYSLPRSRWKLLLLMPLMPLLYPNIAFNEQRDVGSFLDSIIQDEDLKLVLLANLGYYHDDPYSMSLLFFGVAQGGYLTGGGYFVKGGSQLLSDHLARVITEHGGEVVTRHLVTEIIVEGGRAVGIRYRRRTGREAAIREARGACVIANAAVPTLVELLPPSAGRDRLRAQIAPLQLGPALLTVYLGFSRSPQELGNRCYSTFIRDESLKRVADVARSDYDDHSRRGFVFVDYSQIDSGLAPPPKALGVICCLDRLEDWEGLDRQAYRERKERAAQALIARLERLLPGIRETIEYHEVATAKTVKRFTLNPGGTAYGFAQLPSQVGRRRLSQRAPLEGLYFASAWTEPGHGFTGAILSGYTCALRVLQR